MQVSNAGSGRSTQKCSSRSHGQPYRGNHNFPADDHNFPADGDYTFRMSFYYASIGPLFGDNIPAEGEQIEIAVDGERVALLNIDRKMKTTDDLRTLPIRVTAGPHKISAAFIERASGPVQDFVMPFDRALADLSTGHFPGLTGLPHLRNLGIDGPYNVTGVSETPSRRHLLSCRPTTDAEEMPCAQEIIARLARLAFRRPVSERDLGYLVSTWFEELMDSEANLDSSAQNYDFLDPEIMDVKMLFFRYLVCPDPITNLFYWSILKIATF